MSDLVYSHAGVTVAISTTPANDVLDIGEFLSLSYTEVSSIGSVGRYGIITNQLIYDTLDTEVGLKSKGVSDAGNPNVEIARDDSDAGQLAMRVAGAPDYFNAHAFRIIKQDGSTEYLRGLVAGPWSPKSTNEDFDLHIFKLGLIQAPARVPSVDSDWIFATGVLSAFGVITISDTIPP